MHLQRTRTYRLVEFSFVPWLHRTPLLLAVVLHQNIYIHVLWRACTGLLQNCANFLSTSSFSIVHPYDKFCDLDLGGYLVASWKSTDFKRCHLRCWIWRFYFHHRSIWCWKKLVIQANRAVYRIHERFDLFRGPRYKKYGCHPIASVHWLYLARGLYVRGDGS